MSVRAGAGVRMGVRAGVRTGLGAGASCAVAALALGAAEARGQDVLVSNAGGFVSNPVGEALRDLGLPSTSAGVLDDLIDQLRAQPWDLVIIRRKVALTSTALLDELRLHVERGGALHFQVTNLEEMSDPWYDLLGLEGAVDLELPLSVIEPAQPKHPSVPGSGYLFLRDERFPPDFGDALLPAVGATVTERFVTDGRPSTVLSRSGRVLVNGQQWDNWTATGAAGGMVGGQIRWLLRCPADLDLDGAATLADFLVFQNLFDRRDTAADVDGDGAWTVFDFLAYLNLFEAGCP